MTGTQIFVLILLGECLAFVYGLVHVAGKYGKRS